MAAVDPGRGPVGVVGADAVARIRDDELEFVLSRNVDVDRLRRAGPVHDARVVELRSVGVDLEHNRSARGNLVVDADVGAEAGAVAPRL